MNYYFFVFKGFGFMRFLVVSSTFPVEIHLSQTGTFKRLRMFIDAIKDIAEVDILFYVPSKFPISACTLKKQTDLLSKYWEVNCRLFLCPLSQINQTSNYWQMYGQGSLSLFNQTKYMSISTPQQVEAFEACLSLKPDAIFAHRLTSMCPIICSQKKLKKLPPIFFDLDDIEHIAFFRNIQQPPRWRSKFLYYFSLPALFWGEYRATRVAQQTFVCSEQDRRYLQKVFHLPSIITIPNAIQIPPLQPLPDSPSLLFLGTYHYPPNVIAAEFLIERIWPHIYQQMPTARLIIAGEAPEKIRCYHTTTPGVTFTGFVDNLAHLYQQSRVVCCPILSGGGTRIKIIEAAAYGRPIIATTVGAEGLAMENEKEIVLRDDPLSFAETCLKMLRDMEYCQKIASAGYTKVIESYDRDNVMRLIQKNLSKSIPY